MLSLDFSNKRILCSSPLQYKNRPAETFCKHFDPQARLRMQNSKSDPGTSKTDKALLELVCKMDNISVIKMTRVVIVSIHVTLTEI